MNNKLFRKESLERLSSPDELDILVQTIPRRDWLALFSLGVIIVATILWSIYGTIETKVKGNGILLKTYGTSEIYSITEGMIAKVLVKNSDLIKKGDLIAIVKHPNRITKVNTQKELLKELVEKYEKKKNEINEDLNLFSSMLKEEKNQINFKIDNLKIKIDNLNKKIKSQENLYKKGLITHQSLLDSNELLSKTKNQLKEEKNKLLIKNNELLVKQRAKESDLDKLKLEIKNKKTDIKNLQKELKTVTEIRSEYDGKIIEVSVSTGTLVNVGTSIIAIEQKHKKNELEAVFFVPASKGKMIEKNFSSDVSPSTVKKEEFGYIQSSIRYVSAFPATKTAIMNILNNEELTKQFLKNGPPLIVYAKLKKEHNSFSGFEWSSPKGPDIYITSGTLCSVEVTVRKQAPITLVIPFIKKSLGI